MTEDKAKTEQIEAEKRVTRGGLLPPATVQVVAGADGRFYGTEIRLPGRDHLIGPGREELVVFHPPFNDGLEGLRLGHVVGRWNETLEYLTIEEALAR